MQSNTLLALFSAGIMLLVMAISWASGTLLPSQRVMKDANDVWFPVIANGATLGNLVIMSFVMYFIGAYLEQWRGKDIVLALLLGILVSYMLWHFVYQNGKYPDGLAKPLSLAGEILMVYGGATFAVIGLFYFCSKPTSFDIILVGILLALYIPIANHAVLGWLNNAYYFVWCPDIFVKESSPLQFIIWGEVAVFVATVLKLM